VNLREGEVYGTQVFDWIKATRQIRRKLLRTAPCKQFSDFIEGNALSCPAMITSSIAFLPSLIRRDRDTADRLRNYARFTTSRLPGSSAVRHSRYEGYGMAASTVAQINLSWRRPRGRIQQRGLAQLISCTLAKGPKTSIGCPLRLVGSARLQLSLSVGYCLRCVSVP